MRSIRAMAACVFSAACISASFSPSQAGGLGRFLGSLAARAAVRGAIEGAHSYAPKSYTPDMLTVEQLAACIKQATKLDEEDKRLEALRAALQTSKFQIDMAQNAVESQRPLVDHYSKRSVNDFNTLIDRYNVLVTNGKAQQTDFNSQIESFNARVDAYDGACAKRYYADDYSQAQMLPTAQPSPNDSPK